jgi:hypothetical protein
LNLLIICFYPKNNKMPLKFYYQEKKEFFRYQLFPYLSQARHIGLFASANWDFIEGGTETYGLRLQLSSDEIRYQFQFGNPFWYKGLSYDFFFEGNSYDYSYQDLREENSYNIKESIFASSLAFKLGLDEKIILKYQWKNYKLVGGIYESSNKSKDDDHIFLFNYSHDKTDWPIFIRSGYGFLLDYRYIYQKLAQYQVFMQFANKLSQKFYIINEFETKINIGNNDHYHFIRYKDQFTIDYFNPNETGKLAIVNHIEFRYNGNLGFDPNGAKSLKNALSFSIFFNKINTRKEYFKLKNLNIDFGLNIYFHIKKQIARIRIHSIKQSSFFVSLQTFFL